MVDNEHRSVAALAEYLVDDERTTFTHEDLSLVNEATGLRIQEIRAELEGYGLTLAARAVPKRVRGFTTSSNDRWFGPGSCPTHGGATYDGMMVAKYGSKDMFGG